MKVVGYTDRWSAAPGEKLRFMVSCKEPSYQANIVRLIHGDEHPEGPGFKEEPVPTPADGTYRGRIQLLHSGSYVLVPDAPLLRPSSGFTLQTWVYATTPLKGVQGILTKWCGSDSAGYALVVEEDGGLALWLGEGGGQIERLSTGRALRARTWYFVCCGFDAQTKRTFLHHEPLEKWSIEDSRAVIERVTEISKVGESNAPLLMAGYCERMESGRATVAGHFNGKIDGPRLFDRALNPEEIESLKPTFPRSAAWVRRNPVRVLPI